MFRHAIVNGFAHALIEIRQDLIADAKTASRHGPSGWRRSLTTINRRPDIHDGASSSARAPAPVCDGGRIMTRTQRRTETDFEAAAFRRLVEHLRERTDVQNIDLMNLAGFCRNCLSNWYREAAEAQGIDAHQGGAREIVYGMPYAEWQALHQTEASDAKRATFAERRPKDH